MASRSAHAVVLDRRFDERTRIARPAVLRIDNVAHEIRVEDLTRDGCKITTEVALEIGADVTLGLAGIGRATAQVVWCSADGYGCIFHETLPSGSVTAATRNNVDHFAGPGLAHAPLNARDTKWSPRAQAMFIVGTVSGLWAMIISGILLIH